MRFALKLAYPFCLLAVGCANTEPSLTTRKIDQPYTLPEDTHEFSVGGGVAFRSEGAGASKSKNQDWLFTESILTVPLSSTWSHDFLGYFRHQVLHDEVNTAGFGFGLAGLGYSSYFGFFLTPAASLYYRRNFTRYFALETTLRGYLGIFFKDDARPWTIAASVAPIFQLDDTKYLRLSFSAVQDRYYAGRRIQFYLDGREELVRGQESLRTIFPLALEHGWRFHRQWEWRVQYTFDGLGRENNYRSHLLATALSRYW